MTSLGSSDERSILVRHFCRALRKPAVNAGRAKGLSASFCALLVVGLLVPALAEAAWTEPINLSAPGQDPGDPEVAVDADGDAVFTWLRSDGTDYRIQARARSATGTLSAVQTLSAPGQSASRPQVAVDADGDAVFTWLRFDGAKYRIQARARSAGGTLSAVQTLSAAGQNAFNPQVAVDADGDAVFTWLRFDGAHLRVEARARSAAGTLSAVQTLSGAGQHASEPQVAVDGDGDAVFTWERLDGTKDRVQAVARSAAGTLSAVQTLSAAGKTAFNPQVAVDADGDAVFTWLRSDETDPDNFCCHRVQLRTRSTDGALSAVKTLSAAGKTAFNPQVAVDADGDAVFTWELYDGTEPRVQAKARSATGTLSAVQTLSAAGQSAFNPQVAVDADGDAVFTWLRSDGASRRVEARTRSAAGALSAVQLLSGRVRQQAFDAQVAMDVDGDAIVTWQRSDGTSDRVQASAGP